MEEEIIENVMESETDSEQVVEDPVSLEDVSSDLVVDPDYFESHEQVVSLSDESIMLLSVSPYAGTISDTYLTYFRGIVQNLDWGTHYVIYKDSSTSQVLYYSDNLVADGFSISGSGDYVRIYRNNVAGDNNYYLQRGSGSVDVNASRDFVYSDLKGFSDIVVGASHYESKVFLLGFFVCFVFVLFSNIFKHIFGRWGRISVRN